MKNLILCCVVALSISALAACSSDSDKSASTPAPSAPMAADTKDMKK